MERGTVVDKILFCPLHQWGFCLSTGQAINQDDLWAQTYRVVPAGDSLYLALE
ncbi:hypothetical protein C2W62_17530 [Candidatus Entotheonella serta]|nr:hypothetical protein C2W62_17530 [Candidatus Entotheonella serta]